MREVMMTLLPVDCLRPHLGEAAWLLPAERYEKLVRYRQEDRLRCFASSLLLQKSLFLNSKLSTDINIPPYLTMVFKYGGMLSAL